MIDYWSGIFRAVIPKKVKDAVALGLLVPVISYGGYRLFFPTPPQITIYTETEYPKTVMQGDYFFLSFDLSWNKSCVITAKRYIVGGDGIEHLAAVDSKQVKKDERIQYVVRFPIEMFIPHGLAKVRSDRSNACEWFEKYIRETKFPGIDRNITIIPGMSSMPDKNSVLLE